MNKHTTHILISLVLLLAATPRLAAQTAVSGDVSAVKAQWTADALHLTFKVTEPKGLGSRFAVWATPCLTTADGDTLRLAPNVFRGNRNWHYVMRERHFEGTRGEQIGIRLKTAPRSEKLLASVEHRLGDTVAYAASVSRADAPWLWEKPTKLSVCREKEGCCTTEDLEPRTLKSLMYVPPFVPSLALVPDNTGKAGELEKYYPVLSPWREYRPYTSDRVLSREKGALYVHFELDKVVLKHDFRGNAATLDRIVDITRQIMADSTSDVRLIQIVGLASVEGPLKHNQWLADNRAQALKRYIQERVASPDSLYEVVGGGEAWAELRAQIADLQFAGRDEMLRIIDTEKDVNVRERKIKTLMGGRPYDYLRTHVLADQRNSGYLRIYYDYVPDTAAAAINRATELIQSGDYAAALTELQAAKDDPRAQNALGVALYMTGDKEQGMEHIRRAAEGGNAEAQQNVRQWEAIKKAEAMAE